MSKASEEKILGGIAHLGILLNWVGAVGALIIYLTQKDKSSFIGDHAKQALGYQICVLVIFNVLNLLFAGRFISGFMTRMHHGMYPFGPGFFGAAGLVSLLFLAAVIYAIVASVNAFSGNKFKYAVIGDFVDGI